MLVGRAGDIYVASARIRGMCCSVVSVVRCLLVVVISLGGNRIGAQGAAELAAGLHGVPSLTSLKYVP